MISETSAEHVLHTQSCGTWIIQTGSFGSLKHFAVRLPSVWKSPACKLDRGSSLHHWYTWSVCQVFGKYQSQFDNSSSLQPSSADCPLHFQPTTFQRTNGFAAHYISAHYISSPLHFQPTTGFPAHYILSTTGFAAHYISNAVLYLWIMSVHVCTLLKSAECFRLISAAAKKEKKLRYKLGHLIKDGWLTITLLL
jgi:hypothetical protein